MKNKILIITLAVVMLITAFAITAIAADSETEPSLAIEAGNLAFDDSVYILYAVSHEGIDAADIKMLFWTEPEASLDAYLIGTEDYTKNYVDDDETVKGKSCVIFKNNELRAKNMADYVYARAYAEVDGVEYYSEVSKYSILQYCYNKLGKTGTESTDSELKEMLVSMLEYGANAQKYLDYKEDRLANGEFFQIKVEGGVLEDGFAKGLYLATETATLIAPEVLDGQNFAGWKNSVGEIVSTDNPMSVTDLTANETYTATYEEAVKYSEGLKFTLSSDGTYYLVTGIGTCTDTDIVIPPMYNGLPVKEIGASAFFNCRTFTSVNIPDSVISIQAEAFSTTMLERVTLGKNLTSIGIGAFYYSSVKEIDIPDSVTMIGHSTFKYCYNLERVTLSNNIETIGKEMFNQCKSIVSIEIPDSVTSMGDSVFAFCAKLESIKLPASITSIGNFAFKGCSALSYIEIPENVKTVGNSAFSDCTALSDIKIGENITSLGNSAFYNCTSLKSITIPEHVTTIETSLFCGCTSLENVEMGDNITSIKNMAFVGCVALKDITISASVQTIGKNAFDGCASFKNVILPDGVKTIGDYAFAACRNLETIVIGGELESIGSYAFTEASKLRSVYYSGTYEKWNSYQVDTTNAYLKKATIYYYSETTPTTEGNFWHYDENCNIVIW